MTRRINRINELLKEEISYVLFRDAKDPRLWGLFSLTNVQTSADLRHARVFVSVMGSHEDKERVLSSLNAATGFVEHRLGGKLSFKNIPHLSFVLDDSMDKANEVLRLMDRLASNDEVML